MKETIKNSLVAGLVFSFTVIFIGISYAAYESLTDVGNGDFLTSTLFNKVLENQRVFRSEIDILNGASSGSVPTGAVMAFNLSSCPTGWSKANGIENPLDLRGEFIRGWDDGRGVDIGRILATNQIDEFKSHSHTIKYNNAANSGDYSDGSGFLTAKYLGLTRISSPGTNERYLYNGADHNGGIETRPRNISLLYCVKD